MSSYLTLKDEVGVWNKFGTGFKGGDEIMCLVKRVGAGIKWACVRIGATPKFLLIGWKKMMW